MIISNARKTECRRLYKAARQAEIRSVTAACRILTKE